MQVVAQTLESGEAMEEDGIEAAFDLLNEVSEHARSGAVQRPSSIIIGMLISHIVSLIQDTPAAGAGALQSIALRVVPLRVLPLRGADCLPGRPLWSRH